MIKLGLLMFLVVSIEAQEIDVDCTDENGNIGVCIVHHLCSDDNTVITDGEGLIDLRFADQCKSLEVCCQNKFVTERYVNPTESNLQADTECGIRNANGVKIKISNSKERDSQFGEFPWIVAISREERLFEDLDEFIMQYKCGGSLIHPKVVVSSAHNLVDDDNITPMQGLKARAGEWDFSINTEPYQYEERDVATVIVHKNFIRKTLRNDISLLILESPMTLSPTINPICLPNAMTYPDFKECYVTGWGKDTFSKDAPLRTILKKIKMSIMDKDSCENALRRTRLGNRFVLRDLELCAGGKAGEDACSGDGGSPLACPIPGRENQYQLSGIVSWGIGCGDEGVPGVYTNVALLKNWIVSQLDAQNIKL